MILGSSWFENLELDKKCLVKGVFHLSGIFDLRPLVSTSINDNLHLDQDSASVLSPWLQENIKVEGSFLSYFIVAENDSPAFKSQASNMVQKVTLFPIFKFFI